MELFWERKSNATLIFFGDFRKHGCFEGTVKSGSVHTTSFPSILLQNMFTRVCRKQEKYSEKEQEKNLLHVCTATSTGLEWATTILLYLILEHAQHTG